MPEERQGSCRNNGFLSSPFAGDIDSNNNCTILVFIIVFLLLFTDFGWGRI